MLNTLPTLDDGGGDENDDVDRLESGNSGCDTRVILCHRQSSRPQHRHDPGSRLGLSSSEVRRLGSVAPC